VYSFISNLTLLTNATEGHSFPTRMYAITVSEIFFWARLPSL